MSVELENERIFAFTRLASMSAEHFTYLDDQPYSLARVNSVADRRKEFDIYVALDPQKQDRAVANLFDPTGAYRLTIMSAQHSPTFANIR